MRPETLTLAGITSTMAAAKTISLHPVFRSQSRPVRSQTASRRRAAGRKKRKAA